jgi:hypothetical protein
LVSFSWQLLAVPEWHIRDHTLPLPCSLVFCQCLLPLLLLLLLLLMVVVVVALMYCTHAQSHWALLWVLLLPLLL